MNNFTGFRKGLMRCGIVALLSVVLAGSMASAQSIDGRLKIIQETATLKIAYRTDSRPFSFLDSEGRPIGYTIELCQRIAKSLESELRLPTLTIKWVPVDSRTRIDAILNGSADMECGSTTVSLSRMKSVDFSSFVYVESTGVLVKAGIGLLSFTDMAGKKIGVVPGSTNAQAIRNHLERHKINATLLDFPDRQEGVAALARGDLDGFASDKLVLRALVQAANLHNFIMLPEDLSFEPFAIMLPRGDPAFRLAVNTGLARIFRSGEVLELYTKYFSNFSQQPSNWLSIVFIFGALPE